MAKSIANTYCRTENIE